jgi:hypothetical protein
MKPIQMTVELLVLRSWPWLFGVGMVYAMAFFAAISANSFSTGVPVLGSAVLGVFLAFVTAFAVFLRQEGIILDRAASAVVIGSATVFGAREDRIELSEVVRAETEIDMDRSKSDPGTLRRPVLVMASGRKFPLSPISVTGHDPDVAAKAINAWLRPHKP